jgi:hypothetical protein
MFLFIVISFWFYSISHRITCFVFPAEILFFLLFPAEIAEMAEIHFSDWNHPVVKPIQRSEKCVMPHGGRSPFCNFRHFCGT